MGWQDIGFREDLDRLQELGKVRAQVDNAICDLVVALKTRKSTWGYYEGPTWASIGEALGVSPQAAHKRFGALVTKRNS